MNFTVTWRPDAEQDLAQLWVDATDKHAVADAADHLDAALRRNPFSVGESRGGDERVAFYGPLGFLFEVFTERQAVVVNAVWRPRRH
jgi:hypothetical protein